MRREIRRFALAAAALLTLMVGATYAQQTTTMETKKFTVIEVEGNQLVVRLPEGTREITVPPDFKFMVNGQPMTVSQLKPGMSGTATITTMTTVKPVSVTEVKNGTVEKVMGSSILVRTAQGYKMFSEGDIEKRGVKIYKDGQPVGLTGLSTGDKLTAVVVTEKPPHVMTQREVQATLSSGGGTGSMAAAPSKSGSTGAASSKSASSLPSSSSSGTGSAPAGGKKSLPKTASPLPLFGLAGAASGTLGMLLTALRRRRNRS
jgi:hypothetical protein